MEHRLPSVERFLPPKTSGHPLCKRKNTRTALAKADHIGKCQYNKETTVVWYVTVLSILLLLHCVLT